MWTATAATNTTSTVRSNVSRGNTGSPAVRNHAEYLSIALAPRYLLKLPTLGTNTNNINTMPLTAIAYFLPTCVEYSPGRCAVRAVSLTGFGNDTPPDPLRVA